VAVELYLRARHELAQAWLIGDPQSSLEMLKTAAARAPDDPTLVSGYVLNALRNILLDQEQARALEEPIMRILASSAHLGEPWVAYASLRFNGYGDAAGAMRALKRAIAIAPSLADAHDLIGRFLLEIGAVEEAVARLEHALWLDSTNVFTCYDLMRAAAFRGDWDRIVELGKTVLPSAARIQLARLGMWLGRSVEDVEHACSSHPEIADGRARRLYDAVLRAIRDQRLEDDDRALFLKMTMDQGLTSRSRRLFAQNTAELLAYCNDDDEAMRFVQISVDAGLMDLQWLQHNPLFARLRKRETFVNAIDVVEKRARPVLEAWREPTGG
jgi:tetratricopeptide (TPR) repeat protein